MRAKLNENECGCNTRKNGTGPAHIIATTYTATGPLNELEETRFAILNTRQRTINNTITGAIIAETTNGSGADSAPRVDSHANENQ